MPYDSTGTFTIINSCENDRINDISIDSLHMDENFEDIANGLSQAMLRSGTQAMTSNFNMGNNKIQNVANGTAASDAVNKGQLDNVNNNVVHKTGDETIAGNKTFSDATTFATATATTLTVTTALNIPGGSIWIA